MQIMPGGGDVHGYKSYELRMICNNEFYNSNACIMIDGYHPYHRNLEVSFGKYSSENICKYLIEIGWVYDVVETNQIQELSKYFVIVEKTKDTRMS